MPRPAVPPSRPESEQAAPPPSGWQTAVTVLLILHLFCLGWSLATNAAAGKSLLAPALRMIPLVRPYVEFLWMDVAYDAHLASALPEDGAHSLELRAADASAEASLKLPQVLPPPGLEPRLRRQRYQQLASSVAELDEAYAESSDLRTLLPLSIAEWWLRELEAPPGSYRLVVRREPAKRLPKAVERAPSKPREGGPRLAGPTTYATQTFDVHLVWNEEENHYQASRGEPAGQTAEVVRDTGGASAARPAEATEAGPAEAASADAAAPAEPSAEGDAP